MPQELEAVLIQCELPPVALRRYGLNAVHVTAPGPVHWQATARECWPGSDGVSGIALSHLAEEG